MKYSSRTVITYITTKVFKSTSSQDRLIVVVHLIIMQIQVLILSKYSLVVYILDLRKSLHFYAVNFNSLIIHFISCSGTIDITVTVLLE